MAFVTKTLKQSATLTAAYVTQYTVPANRRATLTKVTVHNYSGTARVVNLRIIESGGTGADSHQIYEFTLDANETRDLGAMRHTLEAGDFIEAQADAATAVNIRISGTEYTTA